MSRLLPRVKRSVGDIIIFVLDRDLGAELDDAIGWNREEVGRVRRLSRESDKKPVLPQGHVRIGGGLDRIPAKKKRCRHDVEFQACLAQRGERGGNAWTLHVAIMQDNTSEILGKLLDLKALAGRNPWRIFSQD